MHLQRCIDRGGVSSKAAGKFNNGVLKKLREKVVGKRVESEGTAEAAGFYGWRVGAAGASLSRCGYASDGVGAVGCCYQLLRAGITSHVREESMRRSMYGFLRGRKLTELP
jgi:hypothetical protein